MTHTTRSSVTLTCWVPGRMKSIVWSPLQTPDPVPVPHAAIQIEATSNSFRTCQSFAFPHFAKAKRFLLEPFLTSQ